MGRYIPEPTPMNVPPELAEYLQRELQRIADSLLVQDVEEIVAENATIENLTITDEFELTGDVVEVSEGGTGVDTLTGIVVGNGTAALIGREIDGTANEVDVADADGIAGNPTLSLPDALTFTGKTITGGSYVVESFTLTNGTPQLVLKDSNSTGNSVFAGISIVGSDDVRTAFIGDGSTGNSDLYVVSDAGNIVLNPATDVVDLVKGQLKFPATQSPSSDVNTLDDVERGSWVPGITTTTPGTLSVSYADQIGSYIKIGRFVFLRGHLTFTPTVGTSSGALIITGVPFASITPSGGTGALHTLSSSGWTWPTNATAVDVCTRDAGLLHVLIRAHGDLISSTNFSTTHWTNGTSHTIIFSLCYEAEA